MTIHSGTEFGHYKIRSKLGTGGMGEVYLAQDTKLDRKVALKFLPADLAANQERMRRFVQERDGKRVALSRGFTTSDVVLIKDFK